jgi:hypothetical protein
MPRRPGNGGCTLECGAIPPLSFFSFVHRVLPLAWAREGTTKQKERKRRYIAALQGIL